MSDGLYIPVATSMAAIFKYLLDVDGHVDVYNLQDSNIAAIRAENANWILGYITGEDIVSDFLDKNCVIGEGNDFCKGKAIYESYLTWWKNKSPGGHGLMSMRAFNNLLGQKIRRFKQDGWWGYKGIRLKETNAKKHT